MMIIKQINLKNYRNYEEISFEFSPSANLIIGKNGIGKTNLLEAVSYFTYGRSILNHNDCQLINHNKNSFFIKSDFFDESSSITSVFSIYYDTNKKKAIHLNDKLIKKMSDLYHYIQVVYSGPDDIYNIFSVPTKRRFFIDMAISKIYPIYIDYLRRFKEVLTQRNTLLKNDFTKQEKAAWDKAFCDEAKNVVEYRMKFFQAYEDFFKESYSKIIKIEEENVTISYKPHFNEDDFVDKLMTVLSENTNKEKKYQSTLYGPHLDDFCITIKSKNALQFASQGQKRSIVLALKLALASMITEITNILPILIFDDTLAELDKHRCNNILENLIGKHQIFIASPNDIKNLINFNKIDLNH